MTSYCSINDKKAIITLTKNGKQFKVESLYPPVEFVCKNTQYDDCAVVGVTVAFVLASQDYTQQTPGSWTDNQVRSPVRGVRVIVNPDSTQSIQLWCRAISTNCLPEGWHTFRSYSQRILNPVITNITPPTSPNPKNKGVKITDRLGNIIFDDNDVDCNWSVNCGNCPPGTEEHPISSYPGYCCFNCEEIKNEVQALTAQVRAKNG